MLFLFFLIIWTTVILSAESSPVTVSLRVVRRCRRCRTFWRSDEAVRRAHRFMVAVALSECWKYELLCSTAAISNHQSPLPASTSPVRGWKCCAVVRLAPVRVSYLRLSPAVTRFTVVTRRTQRAPPRIASTTPTSPLPPHTIHRLPPCTRKLDEVKISTYIFWVKNSDACVLICCLQKMTACTLCYLRTKFTPYKCIFCVD